MVQFVFCGFVEVVSNWVSTYMERLPEAQRLGNLHTVELDIRIELKSKIVYQHI